MKKTTIFDIAKKFNLSPSTISKIMNNKGHISKETSQKVLDYIKEINYYPTANARNLKLKRSYMIGVVFSEELDIGLEHPFYGSILQYFKKYVEQRGYEVSFIISQIGEVRYSYLDWCRSRNVDGIYIVAGNENDQKILELINSDIPCVTTEMAFPMIHSVISNNYQGIKYTLDYIKEELKKSKVALISGPLASHSFNNRTKAVKKYSQQIGIPVNSKNIAILNDYSFECAYSTTKDMLTKAKTLPEVIITSSDDIAFAVLRALYELQISVPQDVQVIGFDDVPYAKRSVPALTTIKQDRQKLGEMAGEILLELINDGISKHEKLTIIDTRLIVRETTKA